MCLDLDGLPLHRLRERLHLLAPTGWELPGGWRCEPPRVHIGRIKAESTSIQAERCCGHGEKPASCTSGLVVLHKARLVRIRQGGQGLLNGNAQVGEESALIVR